MRRNTNSPRKNEFLIPNWLTNTIAGMTQATLVTATGYPFDLIKSRMQGNILTESNGKPPNMVHHARDIMRKNGLKGMYRGSLMPWLSHMIKRPVQFPVSEYLKEKFKTDDPVNKVRNNFLIGACSGIIGPIFGTPLQVVKVGMQTSRRSTTSIQYASNLIKNNGIMSMYKGFVPTLVKDCIFGGSFVGTYYTLRDAVGIDTWYKNFFNGATAHCLTWYVFIPIDYVKTTIQKSSNTKRKMTITNVIADGYNKGGIKIFWKGVIPSCLRTIPVSGIAMIGYEYVRKKLKPS